MNVDINIQFPDYNKLLNTLIERSPISSRIKNAPNPTTLVAKIWLRFQRFICWLRGHSANPEASDELQLRYAMHLFQTFEPKLLNDPEIQEKEFPLWQALEAQVKFLHSCHEKIGLDLDKLSGLEGAVAIGKELHQARKGTAAQRKKITGKLKNKLIETFKAEGSIFIPGGVLESNHLETAFQKLGLKAVQSASSKMVHLLYELETREDGQILLRMYDLAEQGEEQPAYILPANELDGVLSTLLDIQTAPHELHHESWWGRFRYSRKLNNSFFSDTNPLAATYFQKGLATYKFEELIGRIKRYAVKEKTTEKVDTSAAQILSLYKKVNDPQNAPFLDSAEKVLLFFEIFEKSRNKIDDPIRKKWLKDTALSLLSTLKYHDGLFDTDQLPLMSQKINEIVKQVSGVNDELKLELAGEQKAIPPSPLEFSDALHFENEIVPLEVYRDTLKVEIHTIPPLNPIDFSKEYSEVFEDLKVWIQTCHRLSIHKELETLNCLIKDIQNYLQHADETHFWDRIPLEGMCLDDITHFLHRITSYQTQVQFGLKKPGPLPHQILDSFKNMDRCQRLVWRKNEQNCFGGYALDMGFFKEILKDPWLDLDIYGPAIYAVIHSIDGNGKRLVNLTDPAPIEFQNGNDQAFYTAYHAEKCPQADLNKLPADFFPLLSRPLVNLRQMKILLLASMARYHTLGAPELTNVVQESLQLYLDFYRNKINDLDEETLKTNFANVDHRLYNPRLPGRMSVTNYTLFDRPTILLDPYNLAFFQPDRTYNDPFGAEFNFKKIHSQYRTTAQEVLPEIAREVIEGSVVNESEGYCDEDGTLIPEESIPGRKHLYIPPGLQDTEGSIIHESRSHLGIAADTWADIRLTQTSPKATRIPNTLSLFCKHPHLLTHHRYGLSFQRVFRLNLFRSNCLGEFISAAPHRIELVKERLMTLYQTYIAKNDMEGLLFMQTLIRDVTSIGGELSVELQRINFKLDNQLNEWQEMCDRSPHLLPFRRAIYHAYLLNQSRKEVRPDPLSLMRLMTCYFYLKHIPEPAQARNRCYEDQIRYFIHRIAPYCEELYDRDRPLMQGLLNSIAGTDNGTWEKSEGTLCFKFNNLEIDLIEGQLYREGISESFLPDAITHDPICYALFGKREIFALSAKKEKIYLEKQRGEKYEFTFKNQLHRIYLLPGHRRFIYKLIDHRWFQLQELTKKETTKGIPKDLFVNFCWRDVNGSEFFVQNGEMVQLYKGKLGSNSTDIRQLETTAGMSLLNSWGQPEYSRFLAISSPAGVYAIGNGNKVSEIIYQDFMLSYLWDNQRKRWLCPRFPEYFLSSEPLERTLHPGMERDKPGSFFGIDFKNYHLLFHHNDPPLLLLPDVEYRRTTPSLEERNKIVLPEPVHGQTIPHLYVYELDIRVGVKSKSPEGYLYLAYLLFTQGKYDLALGYIFKARGIEPSISTSCQRILNLFEKWPVYSNKSTIIRLHIGLLILANTSPNLTGKSNYSSLNSQVEHLIPLIEQYNMLIAENKVPHSLKITNKQKKELLSKFNMAPMHSELQNVFTNSMIARMNDVAIEENLQNLPRELAEPLQKFVEKSSLLRKTLDEEIAFLRKNLKEPGKAPKRLTNGDLVAFNIFPEYFLQNLDKAKLRREPGKVFTIVDKTGIINDPFAHELLEEINQDLKAVASLPEEALPELFDYEDLLVMSLERQGMIENEFLTWLYAVHSFLRTSHRPSNIISQAIEALKSKTEIQDHYVNKMIYATATDDWKDLISSGIIDEKLIPELKIVIQHYLITKTDLQQCQKLIQALDLYLTTQEPQIRDQVGAILLQKRFYDPLNDPLRFFLLLIENDQKIIATARQVEHFRAFAQHKDIFKHEALAGGKTTVLRNLIAAHNADGCHQSVGVTADILIERHHPIFKQTTEEAYGKKCFRIKFTRDDPSDGISLRILLRNLLNATVSGHRIDITRKDGLSLHHAFLLKLEECESQPERKIEILDEQDILAQILTHFKDYAIANTDEMDAITNPLIEHNYALGQLLPLDAEKMGWYLNWMEMIFEIDEVRDIFKGNQQYKLTKDAVNILIGGLSGSKKSPLEHTFSQRNNVHYIRSSDGITVKPALITDFGIVPNENAEFGTQEETILYTCFNYIHTGVTPSQIESLVIQEQNKASSEILQSIKEKRPLTYSETSASIRFKRDFNKSLLDITPEDYIAIAGEINGNHSLLRMFLQNRVFPSIKLCEKNLSGSSYDFINLFRHFSGSSGTANSYRTLPNKICRSLGDHPEFRRQPGVDGAILSAIIREYNYKTDVILIERPTVEETLSAVAEQLQRKPGSTLIDASPLFPGMTSAALAKNLEKYMPGQVIRYLDTNNTVCLLNQPERQSTDLKNQTTILTKGQDRGTHLDMSDDSIGYVTINKTTCYSDFMQAAMRMRKLGKGQKLRFIIDRQIDALLKNDNAFDNIVLMMFSNEAEQLKKIHSKAEPQKVLAAGKSSLFQTFIRTRDAAQRSLLWSQFRNYFITEHTAIQTHPLELAERLLDALSQLQKCDDPGIRAAIDEGAKELIGYVKGVFLLKPQYLAHPDGDSQYGYNKETQNAMEMQSSLQQDLEIQSNKETGSPFQSLSWNPHNIRSVDELVEYSYDHFIPLAGESTSFYDDSIFVSLNLYNPKEETAPWGLQLQNEPLPKGQMKFSRIALVVTKDTVLTFLGSNKDFDHLFYPLDENHGNSAYYIYNLENDDLEGRIQHWIRHSPKITQKLNRNIVQAKLLSGICHLTANQKVAFSRWMSKEVHFKQIEANLLRFLQAVRPSDYPHYPSSNMALIFRHLKNY